MRWDMSILRESPWYQEILTEGEQKGLQQGAQRQLIQVLRLRFGEIPQSVQANLENQSVEQLENLMAVAIAVNSLDEFIQSLTG
ncbi:DUF4351 domain-containing protein [Calothrix anomala FACHB-343]|uniref:DUF4351 domain-containing protein n=3 Tax=Calotrichaceae TaxID=2661849 RepID=A0ABR8AJN8_9CYAN|nr:DUF4351 domain-containing protein [Calothrix parietina FACHB-288]MBD2229220.1 DUF4351 domain-containing protein [Calothrix anomala FACHB-343]